MSGGSPHPVQLRMPVGDVTIVGDAFGDPGDPPVVLLHGGGQTRHSWRHSAEQLGGNGWYATSFDLRGHGDSDWSPDGLYTVDYFAEDVRALARSFPEPPALVGASLGGISSLLAIAEAPEPIATALVLVDVAPRMEPNGVDRIRAFMRGGANGFDSLEDVAEAVASYNPHRPRPKDLSGLRKNVRQRDDGRWYWHWDPRFMLRDGTEVPGADFEDLFEVALSHIRVPTLLVRGKLSDVVTEEGVQDFLRRIPHAKLADVKDAAHMVAGDQNDVFSSAVIGFLEQDVKPTLPR